MCSALLTASKRVLSSSFMMMVTTAVSSNATKIKMQTTHHSSAGVSATLLRLRCGIRKSLTPISQFQ
uniref:Putative secreted peptide n=1 Tax=Anopheles braziliensis TaxID=58242 RepID=A0A2M3ZRW4_9DIPT